MITWKTGFSNCLAGEGGGGHFSISGGLRALLQNLPLNFISKPQISPPEM